MRVSRLAGADLLAPAGDKGVDLLADRRVERRLLIVAQRLLPNLGGPLQRVMAAGLLPAAVVLPVRQHRPVEGRLVAGHGMPRAEEVAAGRHRLDRIEAEVVLVERYRLQE